ncbi:MAG: 3-oxoacyl-ACP reductase family protein [Spirochaetia bacterium]|jgi:3-oxoacyl-[acyl-carrier protein] reductase
MSGREELKGKNVLVTGGSRGIGREVARAFAKAGANVALSYLNSESEAHSLLSELKGCGVRCIAVRADVSKGTDVQRLMQTVQDGMGSVQVLVNNAGISKPQKLDEISEKDWDELIGTNLKSAFLVTQAALPEMRSNHWGRIIIMSSVAAQLGGVVGPHYAASKAGLIGLAHSYAALLAKEGITVNAIAPALIATEMVRQNKNARADLIPVGRFGTTEEVADVVLMLAANGYMTGQTVNVNGGWYMS